MVVTKVFSIETGKLRKIFRGEVVVLPIDFTEPRSRKLEFEPCCFSHYLPENSAEKNLYEDHRSFLLPLFWI